MCCGGALYGMVLCHLECSGDISVVVVMYEDYCVIWSGSGR